MMQLNTKIVKKKALTLDLLENLFKIFDQYYDNVSFKQFQKDIIEKTHCILLFDNKKVVGFSTVFLGECSKTGATILFSGDTILEKAYWGQKILQQAFYKMMWLACIKRPMKPVYWMLMSKGFKTYLLMRNNFPRSYPNVQQNVPDGAIFDSYNNYYSNKFGNHFSSKKNLLFFDESKGNLKSGIVPITQDERQHPEISFFLKKNPDFEKGNELACVCEIGFSDLLRTAGKHLSHWGPMRSVLKRKQKTCFESNIPINTLFKDQLPEKFLKPANFRRLISAGIQDWSIIILTWGILYFGSTWLYPLAVLVIAGRLQSLGVLLHDACHSNRAKTHHHYALDLVCGYPIASTIESMRYHHIRHHRYTCTSMDPYFKDIENSSIRKLLFSLYGAVVVVAWWVRPFFGILARYKPSLKNTYGKLFFGDRTDKDLTHSKQIDLCLKDDKGQLIFQIFTIALAIAFPSQVFFLYIIPVLAASLVNGYRVVHEHIHNSVEDATPENVLNLTLDQAMHPILRFLFFPRNIGFHRIHHLHPKATFDQLPFIQQWYLNKAMQSRSRS